MQGPHLEENTADSLDAKSTWSDMIDLGTLIKLRDCLSHLTNLDFSIYGSSGVLLVPPLFGNDMKDFFPSSGIGKNEQDEFIKNGIQKAMLRRSPSIFRGPMNQYHSFIPALTADDGIVLVGNALYASRKDLEDFYVAKGSSYGIPRDVITGWAKKMVPSDLAKVSEACENIHELFNLVVKDNYGKNAAAEHYKRIATILELFSTVDKDSDETTLFTLLVEMIMLLFGGDTVSIMTQEHDKFVPVIVEGRAKNQVALLSVKSDSPLMSTTIKNFRPLACTDTIELLRLGYPDNIISLHMFPLSIHNETFGVLCIFNSRFSEEEIDTISRLCGFTAFQLRISHAQKMLVAHTNGLTAVNFALSLSPTFQDPDRLYGSILEISSKLVSAEKASLMLLEEAKKELVIKAATGMNKWIAKNIRIKIGSGISGRVFVEGKPLMVADAERNLSMQVRSRYRTKSFISIPLKIGSESIGVLNFTDRVNGEIFSESDITFLQYFVAYASMAIKGAQFYEESRIMRTLSITDSLTGLFNRRYFDERLVEELQRAIRYDSQFSLAILDIDDFKMFNDTEGHPAGDDILRIIAHISRESLRSIDIIARFGGEEFSVIMPQTESEEAFLVAERVRHNIKEMTPVTWKLFPHKKITVSIGIATFPVNGKDAKELIINVDKALYGAKMKGKDRTVVCGDTQIPQ